MLIVQPRNPAPHSRRDSRRLGSAAPCVGAPDRRTGPLGALDRRLGLASTGSAKRDPRTRLGAFAAPQRRARLSGRPPPARNLPGYSPPRRVYCDNSTPAPPTARTAMLRRRGVPPRHLPPARPWQGRARAGMGLGPVQEPPGREAPQSTPPCSACTRGRTGRGKQPGPRPVRTHRRTLDRPASPDSPHPRARRGGSPSPRAAASWSYGRNSMASRDPLSRILHRARRGGACPRARGPPSAGP